jgi:hypothetical protein
MGRGCKQRQPAGESWLDKTPVERHAAMTWMQRPKWFVNGPLMTNSDRAGERLFCAKFGLSGFSF